MSLDLFTDSDVYLVHCACVFCIKLYSNLIKAAWMYKHKLYSIETKGVQQHASLNLIRKHVQT